MKPWRQGGTSTNRRALPATLRMDRGSPNLKIKSVPESKPAETEALTSQTDRRNPHAETFGGLPFVREETHLGSNDPRISGFRTVLGHLMATYWIQLPKDESSLGDFGG